MPEKIHTHYDNLSVTPSASLLVIQAAYDALLAKHSANEPDAARVRAVLNASFAVLSDPKRRADHDAWIANQSQQPIEAQNPAQATAPLTRKVYRRKTVEARNAMNASAAPLSEPPVAEFRAASTLSNAYYTHSSAAEEDKPTGVRFGKGVVWFVIVAATVVWGVFAFHSAKNDRVYSAPSAASVEQPRASPPPETGKAAPVQKTAPPPATSPQVLPESAIGAVNANLRESPTSRSRQLQVLPRNTRLTRGELRDGFYQVRTADGAQGWIAEELLIPAPDADRLSLLDASTYIGIRGEGVRTATINVVNLKLKEVGGDLGIKIALRSPGVSEVVASLKQSQFEKVDPDLAGHLWFSRAGDAASAAGNHALALQNYLAASHAAPDDAGSWAAIALQNYFLGQYADLAEAGRVALVLAPETTNGWLVFGLSMALNQNLNENARIRVGSGAFLVALRYSKNPDFTRKYLTDIVTKGTDLVSNAAMNAALSEHSLNPRIFQ